jgi:hypothetical protein
MSYVDDMNEAKSPIQEALAQAAEKKKSKNVESALGRQISRDPEIGKAQFDTQQEFNTALGERGRKQYNNLSQEEQQEIFSRFSKETSNDGGTDDLSRAQNNAFILHEIVQQVNAENKKKVA